MVSRRSRTPEISELRSPFISSPLIMLVLGSIFCQYEWWRPCFARVYRYFPAGHVWSWSLASKNKSQGGLWWVHTR